VLLIFASMVGPRIPTVAQSRRSAVANGMCPIGSAATVRGASQACESRGCADGVCVRFPLDGVAMKAARFDQRSGDVLALPLPKEESDVDYVLASQEKKKSVDGCRRGLVATHDRNCLPYAAGATSYLALMQEATCSKFFALQHELTAKHAP